MSSMKKYELTEETKIIGDKMLFRIRALRSFGDIKAGDLGGFIENERNLSHEDNAWVSGNAKVIDNARVSDNALVSGETWVGGNARVDGNARVSGETWVGGYARVSDNALVIDNARVSGEAWVDGNARVSGNARVIDNARVSGYAKVGGKAIVGGEALVSGYAKVGGKAIVGGEAWVSGEAQVSDDGLINSNNDYLYEKGLGSHNRPASFFKCKDRHIHVLCGCFDGNLDEFENKVKEEHGNSKYAKEYLGFIEVVKTHFEVCQ